MSTNTMSTNLIMHNQWRTRPADERFATLAGLAAELHRQNTGAAEATIPTDALRVIPINSGRDGLALTRGNGAGAMLTHWSTQQLCTIAHAPSAYLRTLPGELAAECLNESLQAQPRDSHKLLIVPNGPDADLAQPDGRIVRAITSPGYSRIMTEKIVRKLMELQQQYPGWKAPMVYPNGDFGGEMSPCVGFAGDRDAYVCLIDDEYRIDAPGEPGGLSRGIIVVNSEVGAKRLDVILFLCEFVCGNFIIWGFKQIAQLSMRHYGDKIRREWSYGIANVFADYARSSAREEQEKINHAAAKQLGAKKEEVIDLVFSKFNVGKKNAEDAYQLAEQYGQNPRSSWGMVHGLTRLSQMSAYADSRVEMDQAAAKILDF